MKGLDWMIMGVIVQMQRFAPLEKLDDDFTISSIYAMVCYT